MKQIPVRCSNSSLENEADISFHKTTLCIHGLKDYIKIQTELILRDNNRIQQRINI